MKIVLNSEYNDLINDVVQIALDKNKSDVIAAKTEKILFKEIGKENVDGFILQNNRTYTQRAIDFLKRKTPYIPIIVMMTETETWPIGGDFYIFNINNELSHEDFYEACSRTFISYNTNFEKLKRITAKISDEIVFGDCKYNPPRRTFHYKNRLIKKMAPKEGGVLEILASNFGSVVRKEIILERVWHKTDFYKGRSLDVYLTNLRKKVFEAHGIPLVINTIPNAGLILEHE